MHSIQSLVRRLFQQQEEAHILEGRICLRGHFSNQAHAQLATKSTTDLMMDMVEPPLPLIFSSGKTKHMIVVQWRARRVPINATVLREAQRAPRSSTLAAHTHQRAPKTRITNYRHTVDTWKITQPDYYGRNTLPRKKLSTSVCARSCYPRTQHRKTPTATALLTTNPHAGHAELWKHQETETEPDTSLMKIVVLWRDGAPLPASTHPP